MRVCLVISPRGGLALASHVTRAVGIDRADPVEMVWAGDPQLRPAAPSGYRWIDLALPEPTGVGWNRLLVAMTPVMYATSRGVRAIATAVERDHVPRLLLHVGQVAVLDGNNLAALIPASGIAAIDRSSSALALDGLAPSASDLLTSGTRSGAAIAVAADGAAEAHLLADVLVAGAETDLVELLFDAAAPIVDLRPMTGACAVGWSAGYAVDELPAVVDVGAVDANRPDAVWFGVRAPRLRLSSAPRLAAALAAATDQWRVDPRVDPAESLELPGGVEIDSVIRRLMNDAIDRWRRGEVELPPDPFGPEASSFLEWLESPWPPWRADIGRYWNALFDVRADLFATFPEPAGADHDPFLAWAQERWRHEATSPLVRAVGHHLRPPWTDAGADPNGVNLVGYLGFDKSLGDVARRLEASLAAADVAHGSLHYHRSGSPQSADTPPLTDELRYATNVVVVNADQFPLLDSDYGDVLWPGRRTVGYWFWDVAYVPSSMVEALHFLDELWVATNFAANAFRAVTDIPVRVVEIPVPQPIASVATRADLGMPDDRFVFLVTLDHLSVTERKNPVAAVQAFRAAFPVPAIDGPTNAGPVLVVKTVNASQRWAQHDAIRLAAAGRDDIIVIDRHVTRGDQMAYTAHADCLVSLHRAEGLGLHLMEAMWLGTPAIATRYSGNLQFMNDDNSLLVDCELIGVRDGEGYFPPEAEWAEPDVSQAAVAMRRIVAEPELRTRLSEVALASMRAQPTLAATGARIAHLLSLRQAAAAVAGSAVP